jgi:hypothetical protein
VPSSEASACPFLWLRPRIPADRGPASTGPSPGTLSTLTTRASTARPRPSTGSGPGHRVHLPDLSDHPRTASPARLRRLCAQVTPHQLRRLLASGEAEGSVRRGRPPRTRIAVVSVPRFRRTRSRHPDRRSLASPRRRGQERRRDSHTCRSPTAPSRRRCRRPGCRRPA